MNIFDAHISGSLSVSSSAEISGDLTVLGLLRANISGTITDAATASYVSSYLLTSSFNDFTSSYTTGSFTGSFKGDGNGLTNIPAASIVGLNLSRIAQGSATASITSVNGLRVNTNTEVTGTLKVTGNIIGAADFTTLRNLPTLVSGSDQLTSSLDTHYVISGSITQTTWDNIASKPEGIVSGSIQVDLTGVTGYNTFSSSVSTSIGDLSGSVATTTNNLSSSIGSLSGSVATTTSNLSSSIGSLSSSVASIDNTQNNRLGNIETSTGSLNSFTSSIATTIKNKLNSETVVSGSSQINITGTTGYSTFSSSINTSISSSVDSLSGSVAVTTLGLSSSLATIDSDLSSSIGNLSSSVATTTSGISTTVSNLSSSVATTTSNLSSSIGNLSSSVATTTINNYNTLSSSIGSLSSSVATTDANQNSRLNAIQTSTGSLNLFTSSINTTIKDRLNTDGVISGSIQVDITQTTGYSTFSSSIQDVITNVSGAITTTIGNLSSSVSTSIGSLSSSVATTTTNLSSSINSISGSITASLGILSSSIGSLSSSVATTTLNLSSSIATTTFNLSSSVATTTLNLSSSVATTDANQNSRLSSIEGVSGSYATTGSNKFVGNQTITGSVIITENLQVFGSSSITYVTASQLAVSSSIISVNVFEPSERFGGLKIFDSGSSAATASLLWDSLNNRFIYQNVDGAAYHGAMFIAGPRNSGSLGDETALTSGRIPKSVGGDHIDNSIMSESGGNTIAISGSLIVTGSVLSLGTSLISGSSQIDITATTNYTTFSSSISTSLGAFSSSAASYNLAQDNRMGSLELMTSSLSAATSSIQTRLGLIETSTGSLNAYTSSNNTVIGTLQVSTSSLNTFTSSTNTRLGLIETSTGSLNAYTSSNSTTISSLNSFTSSASGRLTSLESASSSIRTDFNSYTSSNNGRVNSLETASGSAITRLSSLETASGSAITRLTSIESITGSISSLNTYTGSNNTTNTTQNNRLDSIEGKTGSIASLNTYTGSNDTTNTAQNNRLTSIETMTGSLSAATSSIQGRLTSIEGVTGSIASLNTFSGSANTRLGLLETSSGSLNSYTSSLKSANLLSGSAGVTAAFGSQTANTFYASPNGSAGNPSFRTIVATDVPTLNQNTTGTAANITATSNTSLTSLSNLNTVGTITGGTWNGTAIGNSYLANSSFYVGTTSISLGRASASQTLSGVTIDGGSGFVTGTLLGKTGAQGLVTVTSTTDWSNYPIGYSGMFTSGQVATGAASATYGFFMKIANRDAGGGWGGIWIDYSNGDMYQGTTTLSSSYATWRKLLDASNYSTYASPLAGSTSIVTVGTITGGTWNGTAIANSYLANSSFYVGTTSISLGRASASQTLNGVSIDGNAATVTNGVYTSGDQTIAGTKTFSNRIIFNSAVTNRPQLPGGMLGLDTGDGNFDIWGISRDYYPSHATAASAWGLRWNGDNNDFEFVGGGTSRVILDMDGGNVTATGNVAATGTVTGSNLSGTHSGSSSGTNTGDQTNISGNAATVTNATFYRQFTVRDDRSDGNDYSLAARPTGLYAITSTGSNGPGSTYSSLIHVANGTDVAFQIAGGYTSDSMYFRGTSALQSGSGYTAWRTVLHNGNYSSYALPLGGGTMTGNINFTNTSSLGTQDASGTAWFRPRDPSNNLHIYTSSGGIYLDTNASHYFRNTAGTQRLTLDTSGNATLAGVFTENSSIRYKKDVETIKYGLDKVLQMRGVTYTRKDNGNVEAGVIAEEMNEISPLVVLKNEEGIVDSVSYGRISAYLIEAIKELKQELNEQNLIISELKSKLDQ